MALVKYVVLRSLLALGGGLTSFSAQAQAQAQACGVVDQAVTGVTVAGAAVGATAKTLASSTSSGLQQAKDGTVRVAHSAEQVIVKNRHGRYLPGTFGEAADRTKRVMHRSGRAITKNVRGRYLPGTLDAARNAAGRSSQYLRSKASRKVAATAARTVAGAVVRHGSTAAVAGGVTSVSTPAVLVGTAIAVTGAAGAYVYCNLATR